MSIVNKLFYGDCLSVMQEMRLGSVDLIYLDPPFNSDKTYNAIYRDSTGRELPDQQEGFSDIWELSPEKEETLRIMPVLLAEAGIDDSVSNVWRLWLNALRGTQPELLAYLLYMTERLIVMKGILKPTGSIYLHCDPTASHYIKALMDAIFGHDNFRNEIVWERSNPHSDARRYGNNGDRLLFYTKSKKYAWNSQTTPLKEDYVRKSYRYKENGRIFRPVPLDAESLSGGGYEYEWNGHKRIWRCPIETMEEMHTNGRLYYSKTGLVNKKLFLDENKGTPLQSIWTDINYVRGKESLGYPTQKPIALLERIIKSSSNKGDIVFDPFCGCATTIAAAHKSNRQWIGIDIAYHAIRRVVQKRLADDYGLVEGEHYTVEGYPKTFEAAKDLWDRDKYQFQRWVVEQVDGFVTAKKTGDGGVDGCIYFDIPGKKQLQVMKLEVKGGKHVGISVVRELRGVLERDEAAMAGLIVMEPLSPQKHRNFIREMVTAGNLDVMNKQYPRMQVISVPEILDGKSFALPSVSKGRGTGQFNLGLSDNR